MTDRNRPLKATAAPAWTRPPPPRHVTGKPNKVGVGAQGRSTPDEGKGSGGRKRSGNEENACNNSDMEYYLMMEWLEAEQISIPLHRDLDV
ncbi:hypothetical protein BKD02_12385 [Brucella sp. 09RB8910]|nr:hypothetical protein BKD02_12385 [Brucella sp. 09RB8910]